MVTKKVMECNKVEKSFCRYCPKHNFVKVNIDGAHDA